MEFDEISLIRNEESMNADTLYGLRSLTSRYPYYQTARLLMVKNLFREKNADFGKELRKVSLFAADRRVLYYMIESGNPLTEPAVTKKKTVVKPVQSYQSAVTTAANNNYGTQWISTNTAPKAASTVLIKVTKTVDVLSAPDGQKLDQQVEAGSEFVVIASKYYNGNLYYEISNGKWIMAKYTTQEAQITAKSGVLTINSKPDYGVPVWRVPGQDQIAGKFLKDGSSWRYFRVANVQGQTWYDLGGNQWVSAKSVLVR